mmetsp:Transcript_15889/g.22637  ORF Transcript_15889/g.22637 Transcript_15889/m.22637 type:complete len:382 (-) Transcript_15889:23-1168(-)
MESKLKWQRSYSWNKKKRRRFVEECCKSVKFPSNLTYLQENIENNHHLLQQFNGWLLVRKKQWMILTRRRQRKKFGKDERIKTRIPNSEINPNFIESASNSEQILNANDDMGKKADSSFDTRTSYIDILLEDEEKRKKRLKERPPVDLLCLFDANLGIPDDLVAHCLNYLHISEHWKLLCISKNSNSKIKERIYMWKVLCPKRWILPRRPRKPWYCLYLNKIREEEEERIKLSDDILNQVQALLFKGDSISKIEKLISKAEKKFQFDVNYCSGVVQERNSILNIAIIEGRRKCAKWLIENRNADIETCDRGHFTPLINAAWMGDKFMVRYLLSKGADRTKLGTCHSTKGLAHPGFKGLNAEGWARKKGYLALANFIQLGLG